MQLIECGGLKGRPCGQLLGYTIRQKGNSISHVHCRACHLEWAVENGGATWAEKLELHELLQKLRRVSELNHRRKEDRP